MGGVLDLVNVVMDGVVVYSDFASRGDGTDVNCMRVKL